MFDETGIFSDESFRHCNNNVNEAHSISIDVKNNIKRMSMGQGLYAQVVMLPQKDLKTT